ncbi:MAG: DNA primase [Planctomycetes bacterium]|nr:DNA primase [Planctomycetota bacterium]
MDRFEDAKLRVKEATDLVALIETYLPLKRAGRQMVALCPFHPERTPSFYVNPQNQFFHCFGCGKSGDVFTFVMEREGLSFREAMELLAERAGIPLEGVFGRDREQGPKGPDAHQILGEVRSFLQKSLHDPEGQLARRYLEDRGLADAIEPWALGYHPARQGALARFAAERRLDRGVLEQAGLLRQGRELFSGRVIFPIEDERGRVVAFGGRIVPGAPGSDGNGDYKPPKYVNSPESPFFNKRRVLFGLHRAKKAGSRKILVMEGYTDVIACHLAGFTGAVAALGTSFTSDHARTLERYASDGVVLLFDGDRAGFQAAERAMRELINSRLQVRMVLMSEAKDPADVVVGRAGEDPDVVTERRARFADLVDGAEDAVTMWFRLLRRRIDTTQAVGLEAAARECASVLGLVAVDVKREALLQEMARHLAVTPQALQRLLKQAPKRAAEPEPEPPPDLVDGAAPAAAPRPAAPAGPRTPMERAELELLAAVLKAPALAAQVDDGPWHQPALAELFGMANEGVALGRNASPELIRYLFARAAERPEMQSLLAGAAMLADDLKDPQALFAGIQQGRKRHAGQQQARGLRQRLQAAIAAGDRATADELTRALVDQLRQERPRAGTS